jgi:ATP-binding cassette subfamily B protein
MSRLYLAAPSVAAARAGSAAAAGGVVVATRFIRVARLEVAHDARADKVVHVAVAGRRVEADTPEDERGVRPDLGRDPRAGAAAPARPATVLPYSMFLAAMGPPMPTDDTDDLLRNSAFLRFVPDGQRAGLRAMFRREHFEFGDMIVREGEPADAFYVLASGRARVVKKSDKGEELVLASLRPGSEFGDAALLEGGVRTASVRCSTSVEVLRLGRDDFQELLGRHPELRTHLEMTARFRALHGFLYEYSNFGRLSAQALQELIENLEPVGFSKGQMVLREGDPAGAMYIVRSGRVRIFTNKDGRAMNLAFCREGDFFGELSLLTGSPRAASAEASSDSQLFALRPEAVHDLRKRFQDFSSLLDERVAQYNKDTEARVPLDFSVESLPAEAGSLDPSDSDAESAEPGTDSGDGEPYKDEKGLFGKRKRRIRSIPFVRQIDEMDCGAASLAMVCRHFGRDVNLSLIRRLCHVSQDGTSLRAICHAATELGLAARSVKASLRNLPLMPLPAIVHWEGNHWTVLFDVGRTHVRVADPASGIRRIPMAEFVEKWSGYAALFDYTIAFENAPLSQSTLAWLTPFIRQFRSILIPATLLAGVLCFLQLLFPIFTQAVVDKVIVERDLGLLNMIMVGMGVTLVFFQLTNFAQQYLLGFAALRIDAALLDFLTRRLLSLPMSYFASRRTGDIQRRLDGARQVRQFFVQHGIGGALALVQLAGALALMALYSPQLTAIFLAITPLYAALMLFSVKVLRPLFADIEQSQGKYNSHQIDAIKGIEAVKAASAELAFRGEILGEFLSVAKKMFRSNFIVMSYDGVLQSIGLISTGLFLWFGAHSVIDGRMTVGGFVAFSSLTAMAYASILRVLGTWDSLQMITVLLNRLNDIFSQEPEQGNDRSRLTPVPSLEGHIELRKVGFKYGGPDAPAILKDVSFEVAPGQMVAIVGRSGSGKTTLIKLLAGLMESTEGSIRIDHLDMKSVNYRDLRRQIGMVLQENHLFDATIASNISFGDSEPDFDRVLWSAQVANAHDFIMRLPLGYETRIGESGLALSGGQKQRIAIARAVYNNPPILIFDEATSALDTESERNIQENMGRLMSGRTCIVIAHRLSTIREANMIVVLEKGEVAETGTHDELMARRGLYFYLSSQQLGI